jgi:hypothetical protein
MTSRAQAYEYLAPNGSNPPDVARVVNDIRQGQLDVTGSLVMASGTTSTVINDRRLSERSVVVLVPRTAAAAGVAWWVSTYGRGKVTLGHDSVPADRSFDWVGLG